MKTLSIDQEKNICTRCGESTDELTYHPVGQFYCKDCEELYVELMVKKEKKKLDEDDLLASMCY